MSFERVPIGTGIGAEPPIVPGRVGAGPDGDTPQAHGAAPETPAGAAVSTANSSLGIHTTVVSPSMRLQILSTEHWSLLASRSLAWNESFSRAGMFLSTLSGAMVALALVSQASKFDDSFVIFALVILPVVLYIGVGTFIRLGAANYYDATCVIGMNRIRAAYLEIAPDVERYLVMSAHDDMRGLEISMGVEPGTRNFLHMIAATPAVISTLNALLVGAIVVIAGLRIASGVAPGSALAVAIGAGIGVIAFVAALTLQQRHAYASIARAQAGFRPRFPTPPEDPTPG